MRVRAWLVGALLGAPFFAPGCGSEFGAGESETGDSGPDGSGGAVGGGAGADASAEGGAGPGGAGGGPGGKGGTGGGAGGAGDAAGAGGGPGGSGGTAGAGGGTGGSAGKDGGAGSGGAGGVGGAGGLAGSGATGGSGAGGGAGGAGGTGGIITTDGGGLDAPPDGPLCPPCGDGEYCNPVAKACQKCTDTSRFVFGTVQKLDVGNNTGSDQQFPRVEAQNGLWRMLYRYDQGGAGHNLGYATAQPSPPWSAGAPVPGNNVNTAYDESGPLLLPSTVSVPGLFLSGQIVLFDSNRPIGKPGRSIYGAVWGGNTGLLIGVVNDGQDDYHLAFAWAASWPRMWWTSMRSVGDAAATTRLFTAFPADKTAVPVPLVLAGGCTTAQSDVAPWVTPDGKMLLFHSPAYDAPCATPLVGQRIWWAAMDATTGQQIPSTQAVELGALRAEVAALPTTTNPYFHLWTPSLSPNQCAIYFAANADGEFDVYGARRQ